jgi:hypothetical protein
MELPRRHRFHDRTGCFAGSPAGVRPHERIRPHGGGTMSGYESSVETAEPPASGPSGASSGTSPA